jgi:hypothetical protein
MSREAREPPTAPVHPRLPYSLWVTVNTLFLVFLPELLQCGEEGLGLTGDRRAAVQSPWCGQSTRKLIGCGYQGHWPRSGDMHPHHASYRAEGTSTPCACSCVLASVISAVFPIITEPFLGPHIV